MSVKVYESIHKMNTLRISMLVDPKGTVKDHCLQNNFDNSLMFSCSISILWKNSKMGWHSPCAVINDYIHKAHRYWQIQNKCSIKILSYELDIITFNIVTKV